jgi:hypothetical protein
MEQQFHPDLEPLIPYHVKFSDEKAIGKVRSTYIYTHTHIHRGYYCCDLNKN